MIKDKQLTENINYWKDEASSDIEIAKYLLDGRKYGASLFFCHLALEKIIKGLIVQNTKDAAPYIHDLNELLSKAKIKVDKSDQLNLSIISGFNVSGRYPGEKRKLTQSLSKTDTNKYFKITKKLFLWFEKQYHQN